MSFQTIFSVVLVILWIDFVIMTALGGFLGIFHRMKGDKSIDVRTHISS